MNLERCRKESFAVVGKEGSTAQGDGFIQKLWEEANAHFPEIEGIAKRVNGDLAGMWGAMTDFSRSFKPWEDNFSKGLYLAGVECDLDVEAPEGWTKWVIPEFEYLLTESEGPDTFSQVISYLEKEGIPLVGAVQDYACPVTHKDYMFFPIGFGS